MDYLETAIAAAKEASEAILEIYEKKEYWVKEKSDESPLTHADIVANKIIVDMLRREFPKIPVVSEEGEKEWAETMWAVDPIDGTREFVDRNGEFTVNIALIEKGRPVIGVVVVPVTGVVYAGSEAGAFRDGKRIWVSKQKKTEEARLVVSRSHLRERDELVLKRLGSKSQVGIGSSLKGCIVAEGNAEAYVRTTPYNEWDCAAIHVLVEAAGGRVSRLDGTAVTYGHGKLIEGMIISNGFLHGDIVDITRSLL